MPINHAPDTHNSAVQASAARLIKLLQGCYPEIESLKEKSESQLLLIQYLQSKIEKRTLSEADIKALGEKKSLSASMRFIDQVSDFKELSCDDQKRVGAVKNKFSEQINQDQYLKKLVESYSTPNVHSTKSDLVKGSMFPGGGKNLQSDEELNEPDLDFENQL